MLSSHGESPCHLFVADFAGDFLSAAIVASAHEWIAAFLVAPSRIFSAAALALAQAVMRL